MQPLPARQPARHHQLIPSPRPVRRRCSRSTLNEHPYLPANILQ